MYPELHNMEKPGVMVTQATCLDHRGGIVLHGDRYFPLGSDPCTQCTCLSGKPEMCISVFCSPPENCRQYHALSDKCCQFVCLDRHPPDRPNFGGNSTSTDKEDLDTLNATNLGLRLVASTVTSFLILALLLFMIHRLRQRRLLLMIRRFHADNVDSSGSHMPHQFSMDDEGSVGYFVGHDHLEFGRYSEPPPPYALWKPPESYIPPGEAPPPYEASVGIASLYNGTQMINILRAPAPTSHSNEQTVDTGATYILGRATSLESQPCTITHHMPTLTQDGKEAHCDRNITRITVNTQNKDSGCYQEVAPIRSDVRYEDVPPFRSNGAIMLNPGRHMGVLPHPGSIRQDPVLSSNQSIESNSMPHPNGALNASSARKIPNNRKKCHSYNEFMDHWQHHLIALKAAVNKRRSLQAPGHYKDSSSPTPTMWTREETESSSSSSPTSEPHPLSPSSSDSSSPEGEFSLTARPYLNCLTGQVGLPLSANRQFIGQGATNCPQTNIRKSRSLDKSVVQLKKLSLSRKKKRKEKPTESAGYSPRIHTLPQTDIPLADESQNSSLYKTGPTSNPAFHDSEHEHGLDEEVVRHPDEEINVCVRNASDMFSRKSLAPPVLQRKNQFKLQPAFLSLPRTTRAQFRFHHPDDSSPNDMSESYNEGYHRKVIVEPNVVVSTCGNVTDSLHGAFHPCPSGSTNVCSSNQPHELPPSIQPQTAIQRRIPRSGSICSETGERRYHCGVCSSDMSSPSQPSTSDFSPDQGSTASPVSTCSASCDTISSTVRQSSISPVCDQCGYKNGSLHCDCEVKSEQPPE